MWTKRNLVDKAFSAITLAGYTFDMTPEEQQDALSSLDSMMAEWEYKGIRIGYAMPANPEDSDIDSPSGIPDYAVKTTYLQLAILIAPNFGKELRPTTLISARQGFDQLLNRAAYPTQQQMPDTLPRGAGNRRFGIEGYPFFQSPSRDQLLVGPGGDLDILEP